MKIAVIYFSGTGNTEYIARYIKNKIGDVQLINMEELDVIRFDQFDTFIFGFPVYACSLPKNVKKILEKFPNGKQSVYIFSTIGFYGGISIYQAEHILKKKGYQIKSHLSLIMPGSDAIAFMKKNSRILKRMLSKDFYHLPKVDRWIKLIKEDKRKLHLLNPIHYFISYIVMGIYNIIEKRMKRKLYADSSCIHCHLCEKNCPTNNIIVENNLVSFKDKCILCMRCLHQCPQEAIQIGKMTNGKHRYHGPIGDYKINK